MKTINNILYIAFAVMVECGVSANYLSKAKSTGTKCWTFINDPDDKRKVLIEFEKLKEDYKKKIIEKYGNPYEYVAKMPIRKLVKWDDKAESFFLDYRYDENKTLPVDHVNKYTVAANWLNMFIEKTKDKKNLKKELNLTIQQFYEHAIEIIKADNIDLPSSYSRLISKEDSTLKEYIKAGYSSLIDWRFGNKLAAKIKDELSESALLEMIAHYNNYDDVFIAQQYNIWASKNSYKKIDSATVGVWRRKKESEIIMEREGNASLKNVYLRQAKGFRPTAPLYMVESDDNHLDLLFIDPDDNTPHKHFHKYKAIVVTDSFNDYVLGYAYAQELSKDLVRAAYLNAMYYVRSITGSWYLPHETKSDRWGLKELEPFYRSIGKYFPTPVGSKNRGYIENFFGTPHWKRCLKIGANNYTGNNMTAIHRGVNMEALARNKKDYPLIGSEAMNQIETFFHRLRHLPQTNGISKHDQWLSAFNTLPQADKRLINDEQFLLKFGITHSPERPIRITNRGLQPEIGGVRYNFDLSTPNLIEYVGKPVSVIYDPFDMSRIVATDFEQVRLIGRDARLNSRALQDADLDSRTYLNAILSERKGDVERISGRIERRKEVLESAGIDAEDLLQAGVMVKELKQRAEENVMVKMIGGAAYDDNDIYEQM